MYGRKVGTHIGAQYYTIGQRKGLNIGGFPEPLFVIGTNIEHNQIFLGMSDSHPGLHRKVLKISDEEMHWVMPTEEMAINDERRFQIRIRYRQPLQEGRLLRRAGAYYVVFDVPQRGITAGQFCAMYDGDVLVASGVIS